MSDRMDKVRKLVKMGFSHVKALEIVIDYERGCTHARDWVRHVIEATDD